MKYQKQIRLLQLYSLLVFICGCIGLFDLLSIPSDAEATGFFGYSLTRTLVIGFLLSITIGFLVFAWRLRKHPDWGVAVLEWIDHHLDRSWLYALLLVLLGSVMIFSFIFLEYFKQNPYNIILARRIFPVFLWFVSFYTLTLITLILFLILFRNRDGVFKKSGENKLVGLSQLPTHDNRRNNTIVSASIKKILGFPSVSWVLAGFMVAYFLFFVLTVFLNSKVIMNFPKYVPAYRFFIGVDLHHMREYSFARLINNIPPHFPPFTILFFSPLLLTSLPNAYKVWVIIILLCYFLSALIIPILVRKTKSAYSLLLFLFSIGLFSYGLQFELERGQFNLVTITLCMVSIYIYHYKHKYRYLAYLLFSIAINLKLWPAIFIVMFINDWSDWKGIIKRFSSLFVFNFILLFVLGYQTFLGFIEKISKLISNPGTWIRNHSITGYVSNQTNSIEWIRPYSSLIRLFFLIIFCLFFIAIIYKTYKRRENGLNPYLLLACTIGALIIPSTSNDYKLSILTGPIAIVLLDIKTNADSRKNIISIPFIFLTSLAYSSIQFSQEYKPIFLQNNFPALMVVLFLVTYLYYLRDPKLDSNSRSAYLLP